MNKLIKVLALFAAMSFGSLAHAASSATHAAGFAGEPFTEVHYYAFGGTGTGKSSSNPAAFADGDVWAIPAGTLVTNVFVVVDTAITGTTDLDVGDDDDPDGWVDGSLSVTLATPGMYGWDAKFGGAYKRIQTAGATDAADIYVVPNGKFYAAVGKEIKLDVTTANTAGALRVVIQGFYFGR